MENKNGAEGIVELFSPTKELQTLPYMDVGTVTNPLPNLEIEVNGIIYKNKEIRLDEYWVKGHKREIEIPMANLLGSDSDGDAHIAGSFPKADIIFKDELKAGDKVAVLKSKDKQAIFVFFRIGAI